MNRDVATVLGDHFQMHSSLFTNYERTVTASSTSGGSCSVLTSGLALQQYLSMSPRSLVTLPSSLIKHAPLRCSETGRYVSLTRVNGKLDSVGTVKRKCFVWNKLSEDGWTSKYWLYPRNTVLLVLNLLLRHSYMRPSLEQRRDKE